MYFKTECTEIIDVTETGRIVKMPKQSVKFFFTLLYSKPNHGITLSNSKDRVRPFLLSLLF